ncbi:hypothetical protein [Archangium lansingense]|uniref:Flagellar hook-length control protein FliK n=1 Tax=Archangium lansingense TaxID=2995310 RepID=A0ABT4A9U6_9BACT|nr:hypothetical protein [Archangium lansinium]MCY1078034.1 hypothetical protein [Archangium lansinium]
MKKITHPPLHRPHSTARPRPLEQRRRTARGQANPGVNTGINELDEEERGLEEGADVSTGHQDKRDTEEQAWRRLEEFRNRGNLEFGQTKQRGASTDGVESSGARGGSSAQHLTAEAQKAAQANPQRSIFGTQRKLVETPRAQSLPAQPGPPVAPPVSVPARPPSAPTSASGLLATGKPMGTYLRELPSVPPSGAAGPTQAMAAVEEARRLLTHVEGIERVSLGENKAGQQVVVVVARRGLSLQSMLAVPEKIQNLNTVIVIALDVLPLRRNTSTELRAPSSPPTSKPPHTR